MHAGNIFLAVICLKYIVSISAQKATLSPENIEKLVQETQASIERVKQLETEKQSISEQISSSERDLQALNQKIGKYNEGLKTIQAQITSLEQEKDEQTKKAKELDEQIKLNQPKAANLAWEIKNEQNDAKRAELQAKLDELKKQILQWHDELGETQKNVSLITTELSSQQNAKTEMEKKKTQADALANKTNLAIKEQRAKYREVETAYEQEKNKLDKLRNYANDHGIDIDEYISSTKTTTKGTDNPGMMPTENTDSVHDSSSSTTTNAAHVIPAVKYPQIVVFAAIINIALWKDIWD